MVNKVFEAIHLLDYPTAEPVHHLWYVDAMSKTVEAEQDQLFVLVVVTPTKWLMLMSWYILRRVKADILRQTEKCLEDLQTSVGESCYLTNLITLQ